MKKNNNIVIHTELIQGTPEWDMGRLGKPSASNALVLINTFKPAEMYAVNAVNDKKGISGTIKKEAKYSDGATTYALSLIADQICGTPAFHFETFAMEQGKVRESDARDDYESGTGTKVVQVGGIESDGLWYSPDGLVGDDGTVEIKCPERVQHMRNLISVYCPEQYIDQIQMGLMVSDRDWCDFVSYNPEFHPDFQIKVIRVHRDDEHISKLAEQISNFWDLFEKLNLNTK